MDNNAPPPATDVDEFIRLVLFCREKGFRIGAVKVGSLQVAVEDLRLDRLEGLKPREYEPRDDMWQAAGVEGSLPNDGTVG